MKDRTNATEREGMESDLSECPQSALLHLRLGLGTSSPQQPFLLHVHIWKQPIGFRVFLPSCPDLMHVEKLYIICKKALRIHLLLAGLHFLALGQSGPSLTNANAGSVTSEQSIDSRTAPSVHESPSASLCGLSQTAMEAASYLLTIL